MTDAQNEFDALMEPYYRQIGRVITEWSFLEFSIDQFIWTLAECVHTVGACITTQLPNISAKLRVAIALVHLRGGDDALVRKFNKIDGANRPLSERRNRLIHDWWALEPDKDKVVQFRLAVIEKKLAFGWDQFPVGDLEKLAHDIESHRRDFVDLAKSATAALLSSPKKWHERLHDIQLE